uniref:Uncharacterized protein n=1 Tax=Cannabis sativa TaxID=3483 RepID=A0A803QDI4_CANSA
MHSCGWQGIAHAALGCGCQLSMCLLAFPCAYWLSMCLIAFHVPANFGHGVTSPLVGITPCVQETRKTSLAVDKSIPSIEVPSTTNTQRPVGDDTELQN